MDTQPLYEKLRYRPEIIEPLWQKKWQDSEQHSADCSTIPSEIFESSETLHQGNARFYIFQDFYSRYTRLYAPLQILTEQTDSVEKQRTYCLDSASSCDTITKNLRQAFNQLGCDTQNITLLPPYQPTATGHLDASAYETLSANLRHENRSITERNDNFLPLVPSIESSDIYGVDILRVAHLRNRNIDKECHWENMDFSGSSRFIQRVWRLARPDRDTLPNYRDSAHLQSDYEISQRVDSLLNDATEALTYRSPNTLLAQLMSFTNLLYTYVLDKNGAHTETAEKAIQALLLLLSPAAPHLSAELWQHRNKDSNKP